MFNLQPGEILLILAVVLLIFGPTKLPQLARSLGQAIKEFKKASEGVQEELEKPVKEVEKPVKELEKSVTQLTTQGEKQKTVEA